MPHDSHSPFAENIPAYAIGALDGEDIAALESHLITCASCRAELAEYRAVNESLLTALPPRQPPAALRKRLQSRLSGVKRSTRPQTMWSFSRLALGVAVITLLGLNLISFIQLQQIRSQQAGLINQVENAQVALAMLSYPNTQTLSISEANVTGTLLLDKERGTAVLIAWDLPNLTEKQTYQIWLIDANGDRVSAGLFRSEDGQPYTTKAFSAAEKFSNYSGVGVTVEPAGGSDHPTGKRILKVDF